jgi:hypothetical protein
VPFDVEAIEQAAQLLAERTSLIQRIASESRSYYTNQLTPEYVAHWVLQFRDPFGVSVALKLLRRVNFVDEPKLRYLLGVAFNQVPEEHRKVARMATAGTTAESGSVLAYSFAKALGWSDAELDKRWTRFGASTFEDVALRSTPIILIEDNLASGIQLEPYLREIFPTFEGTRKHFSKPLSPEAIADLKAVPLYLVVGLELGPGRQKLVDVAKELSINLKIVAGLQDFVPWLEFGTSLWASADEAAKARSVLQRIARELYSDKKWDSDTLQGRLLGYGNLQRLVVFPYNVPKSLLPVFWKFGTVDGVDWMPLFPERDEWRQYEPRILSASPELRFVARQVMSGAIAKSSPALEAVISVRSYPGRQVIIVLPSDKGVEDAVEYYRSAFPELRFLVAPAVPTKEFAFGKQVTIEEVRQYNTDLGRYRSDTIPKHLASVRKALARYTRLGALRIRVYNRSAQKATGVVVLLELPAGIRYRYSRGAFPAFPLPPTRPEAKFTFSVADEPEAVTRRRAEILNFAGGSDNPDEGVLIAREQGRTLLQISFGTILQGMFQDVLLHNVSFVHIGEHSVPFRIVAEESRTPIEGLFRLNVKAAEDAVEEDYLNLQPHVQLR